MIKKKNYKILIGIIIGIVLSTTIVGAVSYSATASDLSYNNRNSGLNSTNVQDALEELYTNANCPSGHYCTKYKTTLELGDYVYYKPVNTSYDVDTSKTGYTGTAAQTINPSELELWRVFNIEGDKIELISEYASSTEVYFEGQTGYLNYVGYLNELAAQYETDGITSDSRHFGYNGQIEYLDPDKVVLTSVPWICSTGGSCDNPPVEEEGGGDKLYEKDYNQLNTVLGTRVAKKEGTDSLAQYWIASRYYDYSSSSGFSNFYGRKVNTSGSSSFSYLYYSIGSVFGENSGSGSLRPIVTLKSGLSYGEGIGTKDSPMKIITS